MLLLLGVAFVAGVVTALSPCVLPVLPIVLAGGVTGGTHRPYAIVAGLVASFTVFTLTAAALLSALGLPDDLLRTIAIGVVVVVGLSLVWPRLGDLLGRPFHALARRRPADAVGVAVLGVAVLMVIGVDKKLQTRVPEYTRALQRLEESAAAQGELERLVGVPGLAEEERLDDFGPAPEFDRIDQWLNSEPLTMDGLRGKVVLIDFWTYSCINCLR